MILQRSISALNICRLPSSPKLLLPFNQSSIITLSRLRQSRIRAFTTTVAATTTPNIVDEKDSVDIFYAEENVSWTSLGVSDRLSRALSNVGLNRPSAVQATSIPAIFQENDVVVAAETGSGKTHGYLVPLFDKLYKTTDSSGDAASAEGLSQPRQLSLVLCPNVMLCEQVVRMANLICNDSGEPLLRVAAVCGRQGWPINDPDIIVSTPAALLNYLYAIDPERRRRVDFIRGVKHVVFDEADMLLCGSFQNQVIRLINLFRFDEKLLSRGKSFAVEKPVDDSNSDTMIPFDLKDVEDLSSNTVEEDDEVIESDTAAENSTEVSKAGVKKRRDWMRARKIYERSKQYIFVAATVPQNGKRTVGGVLLRMFPDARWVSGNYLHCHNPRLEQKWIEVTVETQVDVLIDAVNQKFNMTSSGASLSRTMVFANTVEAVEAIVKVLQGAGIECLHYHMESPVEERTKNLVDFQQKGGVFVCTDAAARGLDIPNISHVIQAEFASSAVDFLHRVGRTARAGQPGLVTSLYNKSNRDLVSAVRQAVESFQPVEKAFSRKRSFRKKLKKKAREAAVDTSMDEDRVPA